MMRYLTVFFISVLFSFSGKCQFFEYGQDPAHITWKQIRTDHFRLIFPREFVYEGQRVANYLEAIYPVTSKSLEHQPRKVPVVLHSHSAFSNGFVAWAPRRMELFPLPHQEIYPHDWLEQSALHEFRHVTQMSKLNQGMTHFFSYFLGEQAAGIAAGFLPFWFLEGDAVATETAFSHSGRGRLPGFEMKIRAISLGKNKIYSYDKAFNGSYKHFVPNHYEYGYPLVAYAHKKFGNDIWNKTLTHVGRNPWQVIPFYAGLKKYTGLSREGLYKETYAYLQEEWKKQADKETFALSEESVTPVPSRDYTRYEFGALSEEKHLIAEKWSLSRIRSFVTIDEEGNEIPLLTPGIKSSPGFSLKGDVLVWSEEIPDARWANRSFSVIRVYDLTTGQQEQIGVRSRYFAPSLSPSRNKIVAVEADRENQYSLIIMYRHTGNMLKKYPSPENAFLIRPEWDTTDSSVYVIGLDSSGKHLFRFDIQPGSWEKVHSFGYNDVTRIYPAGDYIYFTGDDSGIKNVYALHRLTKRVFQVTSSRFGISDFSYDANNQELIISDYNADGGSLKKIKPDHSQFIPLERITNYKVQLQDYIPREDTIPVISPENITEYPVKPYRKWKNLFRFHSWAPVYLNYDMLQVEEQSLSPGVSFTSQNTLSTAFTSMGISLEKNPRYYTSFIWKGWYPVFEFRMEGGGYPQVYLLERDLPKPDVRPDQKSFSGRVYIPFDFSRGGYHTGLIPSMQFTGYNDYLVADTNTFSRGLIYQEARLYFYHLQRRARRNLYPRWGQLVEFLHYSTPFESAHSGNMSAWRGVLYTPGLFANHSLRLEAAGEKQNIKRYIFNGYLPFPRGYEKAISREVLSFSADYRFPVCYPDWNISYLLYMKRLKGGFFFDTAFYTYPYQAGENALLTWEKKHISSLGASLLADIHLFRMAYPFETGVRYAYLPDEGKNVFEFLFSFSLNGFSIGR